jgi:hypothetical protein
VFRNGEGGVWRVITYDDKYCSVISCAFVQTTDGNTHSRQRAEGDYTFGKESTWGQTHRETVRGL